MKKKKLNGLYSHWYMNSVQKKKMDTVKLLVSFSKISAFFVLFLNRFKDLVFFTGVCEYQIFNFEANSNNAN